MYKRTDTRAITVGGVQIGGQNKVVIQSMCNTKTKDVDSTVKQILELEKVGCEIIRVACLDIEDAKAIKDIKEKIHIPIVADIHFDYKIALEAIKSKVDKIRINPGNIGDEEKIKAVVDGCKENNIPIRIGVNAGSLEKDLLEKYKKPCSDAMIESALRHIEILEKLDFYDICLSLKASNLDMCVEAYEKAAKLIKYPLHLGITEAGTAFSGTIKSSIGLGVLLREGIGDTLRVSLSDDPVEEILVCKEILKNCNLYKNSPKLVSCPTCGRIQYDLIPLAKKMEKFLQTIEADITVAIMGCAVNGPGEAREADIGIAGGDKEGLLFKKGEIIRKVKQEDMFDTLKEEILVCKEILKNCNLYRNSPKLVSCPTCGRIQYDLIPLAKKMEKFLQTVDADITVAIMGCAVNGPGEAREADIGIAGGDKEGLLFKKGEIIRKVKQEDMFDTLKKEILEMIKDKN